MRDRFPLAFLCFVALSNVAFADSLTNWTGFYAHGGVGGSYSNLNLSGGAFASGAGTFDIDPNLPGPEEFYTFDTSSSAHGSPTAAGGFATVGIGYDLQIIPGFVIGLLGNYDFGSSQEVSVSGTGMGSLTYPLPLPLPPVIEQMPMPMTLSAQLHDSWSAGVRVGALVSPTTLLFVSGGFTQAEFSISGTASIESSNNNIYSGVSASHSDWRNGYFIGGGLETLLTPGLFARIEYRYADYDALKISQTGAFSTAGYDPVIINGQAGINAELDPEVHSLRATIGWRFGSN